MIQKETNKLRKIMNCNQLKKVTVTKCTPLLWNLVTCDFEVYIINIYLN